MRGFDRGLGAAFACVIGLLGQVAMAEDLALVLGNRSYAEGQNLRSAAGVQAMSQELGRAGFSVFDGLDMTGAEMQATARQFAARVTDSSENHRIVIILAGHFASNPQDGWLLGREANAPTALDVGATGLPLAALADLAGRAPGQAVMMIALPDRTLTVGGGLAVGPGDVVAPQGVTLAVGDIAGLEPLLVRGFLDSGNTLKQAVAMAGLGVTITGFVSDRLSYMDQGVATVAPVNDPSDLAHWQAAQDIGTIEALLGYVTRYPDGAYVSEANRRIGEIRADPAQRAREDEEALGLSRDARREIQRNLTLLGFNTRGIDGVFGRGSRAAIGDWQRGNGHSATGYLDTAQIARLQLAAQRRAAELAEEARQRQIAEERQDRSYWESLGRAGDEAGLRAYLERYPDGLFSEIALGRLAVFDEQRRARTAQQEREAWDLVQGEDTVEAYQQFLTRFPNSGFADAARARIGELQTEDRKRVLIEQDKSEERIVAGVGAARFLIEQRLHQANLQPGRVDGEFDRDTRRAIRRFQRAQGLPVSGYVSQETMVRLLAFGR